MIALSSLLLLGGLSLSHALALPKYASRVNARAVNTTSYDFIIAGGGGAGLSIADRLTEDPNINVLVIEAGPFDKGDDSVEIPGAWNPLPYAWPNLTTEPLTALNNREEIVVCAKVVGGGSVINAMNLLRATVADYDAWATLTDDDSYSWDAVQPYFIKSENFTEPEAEYAAENNITWVDNLRGYEGPVRYTYANFGYPGQGNWYSAATSVGIKPVEDPATGKNAGIFWVPVALDPDDLTRCSARCNHYDRVSDSRPNYHVIDSTRVSKILFNGTQAVGVEYLVSADGEVSQAFASKEVLVSAGATHTPQLLQLSGIGPKALLDQFGIPVVVDLPGVGQNFQDHSSVNILYNFTDVVTPNSGSLITNETFNAEQLAAYQNLESSAYTIIRGLGSVFTTVSYRDVFGDDNTVLDEAKARDPAASLPEGTDPTVIAGYEAQRNILLEQMDNRDMAVAVMAFDTFAGVMVSQVKPFSRGSINIKSTNTFDEPAMDFRTATDPIDIPTYVAIIKKLRQIMAAPDMAAMGPIEAFPLLGVQSDEEIAAALRASLAPSSAHQCCSAAMLPLEHGGVVDSNRKVYGTTNLRVIDISAFPMALSGGPMDNIYGISEKVADDIKKDYYSY
ncbi:GMC oxidoreductase [Aaosphaeria arxii CBS 175.79]|uniref:GMC oxidoreductase n=1 Tax=Aaosphaeria arxii CBS 175.79 TaxID=1450172 RepID=A0A6A5XV00_9PLEO|nr:GMC oxidoreductase [Aaosphaeria arxii CBS 175.79]KAF2017042.1 GMC oxidoreductase [Aaosphaeria arxii CBS 175.79]